MSEFENDYSLTDRTYSADEDPFEEQDEPTFDPIDLLDQAATTDVLGNVAWQAGGSRVVPGNPGDYDFTIKWVDALEYDNAPVTVRLNIHVRPNLVGGWTFGSMWMDGIQNTDLQLNNLPAVDATIYNAVQGAFNNPGSWVAGGGARF